MDKDLKKLSREDLLEMLVNQSREVERLKKERDILLSQLRRIKGEFSKVDSLNAVLGRMGISSSGYNVTTQIAEIDEILSRVEAEQTLMD